MATPSSVGTSTFSFSRVTSFEQCARRYRYRYVDRVREAFNSIEAFMGTCAHSTIEWLWTQKGKGVSPTAEQAVRYYCDEWDRAIVEAKIPIQVIRRGTDREFYKRSGAEMVSDFHRDGFSKDRLETLGLEHHFKIELGGRHAFQGFIDRLARDETGLVYVIDYKTGKRVPASFSGKDSQQLESYALAMFRTTDADVVELRLEYLRTGRILTRRVERSEADGIETRMAARVDVAVSASVFPPTASPLCDWCGYNDLCDAARGARR